ncbi:20S proteasome alpha subunit E2, partial [Perilla frutescens var. hirtella]
MAATEFAIRKINAHMKMSGKSYELVSVDKFVCAIGQYFIPNYKRWLLTFSVNEINANVNAVVVTFQAMVLPKEVDGHMLRFELKQWKFKPIPINDHFSSYYTDPSGTFWHCNAKAIGSGSEGADSSLQEQFNKDLTLEEAETIALSILKQVMEEK